MPNTKNSYNSVIGYSPLENVDEEKMLQLIQINKKLIEDFYSPRPGDTILVAGAGQGQEALILGREWQLPTFGVDLHIEHIQSLSKIKNVTFLRQDLSSLAFLSGTFSLIYCYHVLEHVQDHIAVLRELNRVLEPRGVLFIGFPNKKRLVSYIGTSQKITNLERIKWNFIDYVYRLRGKFDNKYGAHAGFTEKEFISASSQIFTTVHTVRDRYMLLKYPRYSEVMKFILKTGLDEFIFPSNYFICTKDGSAY